MKQKFYQEETKIAGDPSAGTLCLPEGNHQMLGAISIVPENEPDRFSCRAVKENARKFAGVVIKPEGLSVYPVESVIRELQRQGVAAIHIAAAKKNTPAQKLCRKTGFDFLRGSRLVRTQLFHV